MKFIKIFAAFFAAALLCVCLPGCEASGSSALMCVEKRSPGRYDIHYKELNGTKHFDIEASPGSTRFLTGMVTTDSGEASIEIKEKDSDEAVYSARFAESGDFELPIGEKAYRVYIKAEKHSGGVVLEWESERRA